MIRPELVYTPRRCLADAQISGSAPLDRKTLGAYELAMSYATFCPRLRQHLRSTRVQGLDDFTSVTLAEYAESSTGAGHRICCQMNTAANHTTTKAAASAATPAITADLGELELALNLKVSGASEEMEIKLPGELEDPQGRQKRQGHCLWSSQWRLQRRLSGKGRRRCSPCPLRQDFSGLEVRRRRVYVLAS